MTHQRPTGWPALYLLLAVTALSQACREVGTAPDTPGAAQLSQAGAIDRPFTGACEVILQEEQLSGGQVQLTGQGTCELTYLGRSAYRIVQTGAASSGSFTGTAVFTAANGDELHGTFTGPSAGTGIVTFAGGTGRFRSASGSAGFARGPGKKQGTEAPGLADRYDGTLRFDPSGQEPGGEEPVRFTLDNGSGVTGAIGPDGGTLTARSAAGVDYTFIVPPNALMDLTTITMTPIASVQNLPLSGGFAGGVHFQPAGLRFLQPAKLQLTIAGRPGATFRPLSLHYQDGESLALPDPVVDGGNVITVSVPGFSNTVVGWGTDLDVERIAGDPATGAIGDPTAPYRQQILGLSPTLQFTPAVRDVFSRWFRDLVLTPLGNATHDFQLFLALAEYWRWWDVYLVPFFGQALVEQQFAQELAEFDALAAVKLGNAIQGNLDVCRDQGNLVALANTLYWWHQAVAILAEENVVPTRATLRQQIRDECARVVLVDVDLPQLLEVDKTYLATLQFAVDVGASANRTASPFSVALSPPAVNPFLIPSAPTATDAAGLVQFEVTATDEGAVGVVVEACLVLPNRSQATPDVCIEEKVLRQAHRTVAVSPASVTLAPGATQQFDATVSGTGNTAVTWTATGGTITAGGFYTAGDVPGTYSVTATSVADPSASNTAAVTIGTTTGVRRVNNFATFSVQALTPFDASNCDLPVNRQAPEGALKWADSAQCSSLSISPGPPQIVAEANAGGSVSFDEAYAANGDLISLAASFDGTVTAQSGDPNGTVTGVPFGSHASIAGSYAIQFDLTVATSVAINVSDRSGGLVTGGSDFQCALGTGGTVVLIKSSGMPVGGTFPLPAGTRCFVAVGAGAAADAGGVVSATARFNLTATFAPAP